MGQSSIPTLNKTGNSMYWNSMWDDKHNFNKSLHESMFLKEFIPNFFSNFSSRHSKLFLKTNPFLKKKPVKYVINVKDKAKRISKFKKHTKKLFFSKIWIMKFNNFIIIYFFLYNTIFKDKFFFLKKKKNYFLSTIMNNYITSIINYKLKNKKYVNIQHKKYTF